jgi:outer membrane lipoprotein carrier protein
MKKRPFFATTILALFALLVLPSISAADSLDQIVSRLQKEYETITTISASFTQEVTGGGNKLDSEGTVFFKKPGRMKWIYKTPNRDELVSDGKTVWFFQSDLNQVMERPIEGASSVATDFLTGVGNLKKDFEITLVKENGSVYRLALSPNNPQPNLKRFYIEVDKTNFLVIKTIVENYFGTVTTVSFRNIRLNVPIKDSFFEFSPPKGAAVIKP